MKLWNSKIMRNVPDVTGHDDVGKAQFLSQWYIFQQVDVFVSQGGQFPSQQSQRNYHTCRNKSNVSWFAQADATASSTLRNLAGKETEFAGRFFGDQFVLPKSVIFFVALIQPERVLSFFLVFQRTSRSIGQ